MVSATRAACCMLWVTMTIVHWSFNADQQIFDLGGGDRIERRAGLVEQQHFRIHGQRARNAEPLLLAAGERVGRFVQFVLHLIPQRGPAQALLHDFRSGGPLQHPVDPRARR